MPVNTKYLATFEADQYFHLIAKAAGKALLFNSDENRRFFLRKYQLYSAGYLDTYSYVLMDNHVHWLVKCTSYEDLTAQLSALPDDCLKMHQKKFINKEISFEQALEFQCKDFFISYAMAYNKENRRSGALFINPFRRIKVVDQAHFTQLVIYHHANVLKHRGQKNFQDYQWSSYKSFLSEQNTHLKRAEVLGWFGGKERFVTSHYENAAYYYDHSLSLE